MRKLGKVGIGIGIVFLGLLSIGIVASILDPTPPGPPKKVVEVQKPKVQKPKPKKVAKKVEKPKPKVAKKYVSPEYTAEQVYRFALEYEVREGQSVADILALAVIAMRGSGQTVKVVERQAQEYRATKGVWVVSCVVLVDGFERTQIRWEADMRNKTVKPLNKVARDLWGY